MEHKYLVTIVSEEETKLK